MVLIGNYLQPNVFKFGLHLKLSVSIHIPIKYIDISFLDDEVFYRSLSFNENIRQHRNCTEVLVMDITIPILRFGKTSPSLFNWKLIFKGN